MHQNQILWYVTGVTLFFSLHLGSTFAELLVEPAMEVTVQPEAGTQVKSFAILTCNIFPTNATVDTRWVLPNGQIISQASERYRIAQGLTDVGLMSSVLLIQYLSYEDAGFYTCEVVPRGFSRSYCTCADFPFSATTELQLLVNVFAIDKEITAEEGNDPFVNLVCEMHDYVRPDEDLLWLRDGKLIYDGVGSRYSITFEDGEPDTAQNGSNSTVAGRRSVLHIQDPTTADTGEYVCIVRGTSKGADISLTVNKVEDKEPTDGILTSQLVTSGINTDVKGPDSSMIDLFPNGNAQKNNMTTSVKESNTVPPNISCDIRSMHIAVAIISTFFFTAVISVLLTLLVMCVCFKHHTLTSSKQQSVKRMSISSPTSNEEGNIVSALNTSACEEAGFIPPRCGSK